MFRSFLYELFFYSWTVSAAFLFLPLLVFRLPGLSRVPALWIKVLMSGAKVIIGLDYRVTGKIPERPALIAAKHQSAWETLIFMLVLEKPVYILKKELLRIPIFGSYLKAAGMIAVDRGGGAKSLKNLISVAKEAMSQGGQVIIFPEGTRKAPGEAPDYKSGIAALYEASGLPVTPLTLNSGHFWGRGFMNKRAGTITLEFLPPIPPGLARGEFMARLESEIEEATGRLTPSS